MFEKNKKTIGAIIAVALFALVAYFAYQYFANGKTPKEVTANWPLIGDRSSTSSNTSRSVSEINMVNFAQALRPNTGPQSGVPQAVSVAVPSLSQRMN